MLTYTITPNDDDFDCELCNTPASLIFTETSDIATNLQMIPYCSEHAIMLICDNSPATLTLTDS